MRKGGVLIFLLAALLAFTVFVSGCRRIRGKDPLRRKLFQTLLRPTTLLLMNLPTTPRPMILLPMNPHRTNLRPMILLPTNPHRMNRHPMILRRIR